MCVGGWGKINNQQTLPINLICKNLWDKEWGGCLLQGVIPVLVGAELNLCNIWSYIFVSKVAARVETVLVYHHTFSLLCGKTLTMATFLLLEYGFLTDPHLEANNAKGGDLNRNCF